MSGAPLFTLVIFMKVDNIVDVCVEFCFILKLIYVLNLLLKKKFVNLTINMQLLYIITNMTSQVHSARHHQRVGYSALPSV